MSSNVNDFDVCDNCGSEEELLIPVEDEYLCMTCISELVEDGVIVEHNGRFIRFPICIECDEQAMSLEMQPPLCLKHATEYAISETYKQVRNMLEIKGLELLSISNQSEAAYYCLPEMPENDYLSIRVAYHPPKFESSKLAINILIGTQSMEAVTFSVEPFASKEQIADIVNKALNLLHERVQRYLQEENMNDTELE